MRALPVRLALLYVLAALAIALLAGCSLAPGGVVIRDAAVRAVERGVDDRKEYNDAKAEVLPALVCDISIGAYSRMAESNIKRGIAMLCGLADGVALAADLKAIIEMLRSLDLMPAVPTGDSE